jgi:hypothetical protein
MAATAPSASGSTAGAPSPAGSGGAGGPGGAPPRREGPPALFKLLNPVIAGVLRSPLAGLLGGMGEMLALLTFTGRKTGKRYSIPVGYHRFDGEPQNVVYLVTSAPWWKNLRAPRGASGAAGAPVALRIKGREIAGQAQVITEPDELYRRYRTLLDRHGVKNAMRLGLRELDPSHDPSEAELRAALVGHVMIRVTLAQG